MNFILFFINDTFILRIIQYTMKSIREIGEELCLAQRRFHEVGVDSDEINFLNGKISALVWVEE